MKKVFSISVIAALAILPMVANAENGDIVAGAPKAAASESQAKNTVTAGEGPKYALAVESATDNTQITKKIFYTQFFHNSNTNKIR